VRREYDQGGHFGKEQRTQKRTIYGKKSEGKRKGKIKIQRRRKTPDSTVWVEAQKKKTEQGLQIKLLIGGMSIGGTTSRPRGVT